MSSSDNPSAFSVEAINIDIPVKIDANGRVEIIPSRRGHKINAYVVRANQKYKTHLQVWFLNLHTQTENTIVVERAQDEAILSGTIENIIVNRLYRNDDGKNIMEIDDRNAEIPNGVVKWIGRGGEKKSSEPLRYHVKLLNELPLPGGDFRFN